MCEILYHFTLLFFQYGLDYDTIGILRAAYALVAQRAFLHIEYDVGVEMLSVNARFEMQMLGGCPSCASCQANRLSGPDGITALYQVLGVVAVDSLQPRLMAHDDDIAVCTVRL